MDKNAIKKYAVWARRELISRVSQRAALYGITDQNADPSADSVGGRVLTDTEKKERQALLAQIRSKGYEEVMEEVAYTWFNRFSALRFMEVNGYLPTHVRVFTDDENRFVPQIMTEAINLELDGLDMEKVYDLKNHNDDDELFKYLIITQCNALNAILPGMFQKIADYTELLFPDNLLREGSVIEQMITLIPEEDWQDQVQIIGWIYQYYNSDNFNVIFDGNMSKNKVTKDLIPAATQLFTPDWVVRYMVENSLGRLWVEGHPNDELKSNWKYYLEEAEQEPEVQVKLAEIRKEYAQLNPEDLKVIDPCCGSGHILAYMFDVLVQIYEANGYVTRDAVRSIVENNIYGLDIDDRAAQLAYFSVMMKGRQYDSRFFKRGVQPHVYAIEESNNVDKYALEYFCNGDAKLTKAMNTIIKELHDAKEYGSILTVTPQDWTCLYDRFDEIYDDISLYRDSALAMLTMVQVTELLSGKFHVVITNPPYLGSSRFSDKLANYIKLFYPCEKYDLAMVMLNRMLSHFSIKHGMVSGITTASWMYLKSFEQFRKKVIYNYQFINIVDFGTELFDGKVGHLPIVSWVNRNVQIQTQFTAICLVDYCYSRKGQKKIQFKNPDNQRCVSQKNLLKISGAPIAYSLSSQMMKAFNGSLVKDYGKAQKGLDTCDIDRFVRGWHEVAIDKIGFFASSNSDTFSAKWYPYSKGGACRKWYGNVLDVVLWENNGAELRNFRDDCGKLKSRPQNTEDYFKPLITWSAISSSPSMRYINNSIYGGGGTAFVPQIDIFYCLAFLNTKIAEKYLKAFSPTINYEAGQLMNVPLIYNTEYSKMINTITRNCVHLAKQEWDMFENSWNFKRHPLLITRQKLIYDAFSQWVIECQEQYNQLKENEEDLNRIFIDIYGLQDELTPEAEEKDITIRKADLQRDIKSLISYAVGCMFGRYSLDVEGLAYAGGEWDASKYISFPADKDNIIPICDDEYFEDDIVNRFVKFIEVVYGKETLEENLKFIADALGGKGQSRDVIRSYFLNDFYADHLKIYQKRPIYWLFDSGKKSGFKCLIYMHRYQPDTIARIRTDYVHEQQSRYRTAIGDLENRIANAGTSERVKLNKQLKKLQDQAEEVRVYEEKIHHLADQMISIDLDDGVKVNYAKFQDVLSKIK